MPFSQAANNVRRKLEAPKGSFCTDAPRYKCVTLCLSGRVDARSRCERADKLTAQTVGDGVLRSSTRSASTSGRSSREPNSTRRCGLLIPYGEGVKRGGESTGQVLPSSGPAMRYALTASYENRRQRQTHQALKPTADSRRYQPRHRQARSPA